MGVAGVCVDKAKVLQEELEAERRERHPSPRHSHGDSPYLGRSSNRSKGKTMDFPLRPLWFLLSSSLPSFWYPLVPFGGKPFISLSCPPSPPPAPNLPPLCLSPPLPNPPPPLAPFSSFLFSFHMRFSFTWCTSAFSFG